MVGGEVYSYVRNSPLEYVDPFGLDQSTPNFGPHPAACEVFHTAGPREVFATYASQGDWRLVGEQPDPFACAECAHQPLTKLCFWARLLTITDYFRQRITVSVICTCPLGFETHSYFQKGKETRTKEQLTTTTRGYFWGSEPPCTMMRPKK